MAFQRNAFQNNAFQTIPIPTKGILTALSLGGYGAQRDGSFAGKIAAIPVAAFGGGGRHKKHRKPVKRPESIADPPFVRGVEPVIPPIIGSQYHPLISDRKAYAEQRLGVKPAEPIETAQGAPAPEHVPGHFAATAAESAAEANAATVRRLREELRQTQQHERRAAIRDELARLDTARVQTQRDETARLNAIRDEEEAFFFLLAA